MFGIWTSVIEVAALRRDAAVFGHLTLANPTLAYGIVTMCARFFDDINFNDHAEFEDDDFSSVDYSRNGISHRTDGPAMVFKHGYFRWYHNGKLHRVHGPAVKDVDSTEWWCDGCKHRIDGPAVETDEGEKIWYKRGKRHRSDGPAFVDEESGYKAWYVDGDLHRTDGPAVVIDNTKLFYIRGVHLSRAEFFEQIEICLSR